MTPILYLVVPCYNEEQVLPLTSRVLREKMESLIERSAISPDSRILLVDDICTTGNSFAAAVSVLRERGALRVI